MSGSVVRRTPLFVKGLDSFSYKGIFSRIFPMIHQTKTGLPVNYVQLKNAEIIYNKLKELEPEPKQEPEKSLKYKDLFVTVFPMVKKTMEKKPICLEEYTNAEIVFIVDRTSEMKKEKSIFELQLYYEKTLEKENETTRRKLENAEKVLKILENNPELMDGEAKICSKLLCEHEPLLQNMSEHIKNFLKEEYIVKYIYGLEKRKDKNCHTRKKMFELQVPSKSMIEFHIENLESFSKHYIFNRNFYERDLMRIIEFQKIDFNK